MIASTQTTPLSNSDNLLISCPLNITANILINNGFMHKKMIIFMHNSG